MKIIFSMAMILALTCGSISISQAQINAITSDGKKVLLFDDGTWKYVFETDGRKVILNPDGTWRYELPKDSTTKVTVSPAVVLAPVVIPVLPTVTIPVSPTNVAIVAKSDSTEVVVDSVKVIPPPPPKPKPPLNLTCSALVSVEKEKGGDKYNAVSKNIIVSKDLKTGFTIAFHKTKNSPLTWVTTLMGAGQCIDTENKIFISFKDGARIQILNDGKANCDGTFKLLFGGVGGKEEILEALQSTEVAAIRIFTVKGYVEQTFDEEASLRFKAALNCMPK